MAVGENPAILHSTSRLPELLLAAILVSSAAPASAQAPYVVVDKSQFGILYVYHLTDLAYANGAGATGFRRVRIYIDDAKPFSLLSGRHASVWLPSGIHTVYAKFSLYNLRTRLGGGG